MDLLYNVTSGEDVREAIRRTDKYRAALRQDRAIVAFSGKAEAR